MVTVADLNGNGAMDIITSTNRGTFVFCGKPHSARTAAEQKALISMATESPDTKFGTQI
jgi:hypothetical protein